MKTFRQFQAFWRYACLVALGVVFSLLMASMATPAEVNRILPENSLQPYHLTNLSDEAEVALGIFLDTQEKAAGLAIYTGDPDLTAYINRIGQRLAAVSMRPNLPYTFQIVEDDEINAIATVGGFVYLHLGLIRAAANEAELAAVMAHEIGHIEARHGLEFLWQTLIADQRTTVASPRQAAFADLGLHLRLLSHSHESEYEADARSLAILGQAGYAPTAAISFLERVNTGQGPPPGFLSTHPNARRRLDYMRERITEPPYPEATEGLDGDAYRSQIGE